METQNGLIGIMALRLVRGELHCCRMRWHEPIRSNSANQDARLPKVDNRGSVRG